jgi:ribonuclease PH
LQEKDAQELEIIIAQALEVSIMVEKFPKSVIEINMLILESDGGALSAAITAGSLALADAGILCYDLVACCSAVRILSTPYLTYQG